MSPPLRLRARPRRLSWWLLLSLLPALTFMGHWPTYVDLPGTDLYLTVPFANVPEADSQTSGAAGRHGQHCHGDSASCSDVPATAGNTLGLVNGSVVLAGAAGLLVASLVSSWQPRWSHSPLPGRRPPRAGLTA